METILEIEYLKLEENRDYDKIAKMVIETCFETEHLEGKNMYVDIIFTDPENIQKLNKKYRKINSATDVLSFPMFEKEELAQMLPKKDSQIEDTLGDIIISIPRVKEQAQEYGHSFQRELAYMIVHGFYHLMGYDHMQEEEKQQMRKKEEQVLEKLQIVR